MTNDKSPFLGQGGDLSFVILGKRGTEGTVPSFPKFLFESFKQLELSPRFQPHPSPHDEIQKSPESKNDPEGGEPNPDIAIRMLKSQCHTGKNSHDGAGDQPHCGNSHMTH